jgi:hypothetical protein
MVSWDMGAKKKTNPPAQESQKRQFESFQCADRQVMMMMCVHMSWQQMKFEMKMQDEKS